MSLHLVGTFKVSLCWGIGSSIWSPFPRPMFSTDWRQTRGEVPNGSVWLAFQGDRFGKGRGLLRKGDRLEHFLMVQSIYWPVQCWVDVQRNWSQTTCIFMGPGLVLWQYATDLVHISYLLSWIENNCNEWCFRPQFCTCKTILGWAQPGLMRWMLWCRSYCWTFWPVVQHTTTVSQMPPLPH